MSLNKRKIVLEPVLQHRQSMLLGQKSQEWDWYFKTIGLSKLGDLLTVPLVEEMVYDFIDNFDWDKKSSSVHGRVIHVSPETFESSLGATFGSDGRGGSGFVPPIRMWKSDREWIDRFADVDNARDSQRSDGWRLRALKPEKQDVYRIFVRAVLMKCDCSHVSNAVATALVMAENGGENDQAVNWATYCYNNFIKEMQRLAKSNGKGKRTVIGQLIFKILRESLVPLPTSHSPALAGTQPETRAILEFFPERGGDSQSDVEWIFDFDFDVEPGNVEKFGSDKKAGHLACPERARKIDTPAVHYDAQKEATGMATATNAIAAHAAMYESGMSSQYLKMMQAAELMLNKASSSVVTPADSCDHYFGPGSAFVNSTSTSISEVSTSTSSKALSLEEPFTPPLGEFHSASISGHSTLSDGPNPPEEMPDQLLGPIGSQVLSPGRTSSVPIPIPPPRKLEVFTFDQIFEQ